MLIFTILATANTLFVGWVAFHVMDFRRPIVVREPEVPSGYWANSPEYDYNPNEPF